jgi:prepilin-type processing-associated H-X9-DG protein
MLLPYLDEKPLYDEFRLDESWDSSHNLALLPRMPKVYEAPRRQVAAANAPPNCTFYQGIVGPRTGFDATRGVPFPGGFPNGTSNTILLVEGGTPVPWSKPEDVAYDPDGPLPPLGGIFTGERRLSLIVGKGSRQCNIAFADGSVDSLFFPVSEAALRDAIERGDGPGNPRVRLFER